MTTDSMTTDSTTTDSTTTAPTPAATLPAALKGPTQDQEANNRLLLLQDIRVTWNRFSREDVGLLTCNDDLVAQLIAKYGLETEAAQRAATATLKGRSL